MTIRRAFSWMLIVAMALASVPAQAQGTFAPNTVWGQVPQGLSGNVGSAVLLDANGNVIATAQLVDGQFQFPNVAPGDYTVQLKDTNGQTLATSPTATMAAGNVVKVTFTGNAVVGGAVPGGGGSNTTLIVAGGAIAIGVGTAIVVNENNKNKDKNKSPKK